MDGTSYASCAGTDEHRLVRNEVNRMKLVIEFDSENIDQTFLACVINQMVDGKIFRILMIEPQTSMETEVKDYLNAEALERYSE